MQYWKPDAENEFAGDLMPCWDGARFHLFYLLDRSHHAELGGLGGHHWAHVSIADLTHWEHHPPAIAPGAVGAYDQNGICTGSICKDGGTFHAFYASRIRRTDGSVHEAVSRAGSADLVHFEKSPQNPLFAAPPELDSRNHRDPYVFRHPETGTFHMLVTASRPAGVPGDGPERGCLAHYTSLDLAAWEYGGPFLGLDADPAPECPEHFFWNGWWYLLYSQHQQMRYWLSRAPLGPWQRRGRGTIEGPNLTVPRTAAFADGRRLAAGFLPEREQAQDSAGYVYAGNVVIRELLQEEDGTLRTRFVPEMMPLGVSGEDIQKRELTLSAADALATACIPDVPVNSTLRLRFQSTEGVGEYGLLLRAASDLSGGYRLSFVPRDRRVTLRRWPESNSRLRAEIADIDGLEEGADVTLCLSGSIIDVCVNGRRTMVERVFDFAGTTLGLFARAGTVRVSALSVQPLAEA